jgi:hypothetical protein
LQFDKYKLRLNLKGKSCIKLKRKVHEKKREIVDFSSINLYKMEKMLEEEEIIEIVTAHVTG